LPSFLQGLVVAANRNSRDDEDRHGSKRPQQSRVVGRANSEPTQAVLRDPDLTKASQQAPATLPRVNNIQLAAVTPDQ